MSTEIAPPARNTKGYTAYRIAEIERLFASGASNDQVAEACGITRAGLSQYIKRNHVQVPKWAGRKVKSTSRLNIKRVVVSTVDTLAGIAQGLQLVPDRLDIERELAQQLLIDTREALRAINAMVAALREAAK